MSKDALDKGYGRDQVVKIVNSVISKVEHTPAADREIFTQLSQLKGIIDEARKELSVSRPSEIHSKHIPTATDELDAIVDATAGATGAIMDSCEVIEQKASEIGNDAGDVIGVEITKIYEACSFQDITGQRISKVVKTLHEIEDKVAKLMAVVGERLPGLEDAVASAEPKIQTDEDLLNGPQLDGQGVSQDDIDRILAEFDD